MKDHQATQDILDHQGHLVMSQGHQDPLAQKVTSLDHQDQKAQKDMKDHQDLQAQKDMMDHQDQKAQRDTQDHLAMPVMYQDLLAHVAQLAEWLEF